MTRHCGDGYSDENCDTHTSQDLAPISLLTWQIRFPRTVTQDRDALIGFSENKSLVKFSWDLRFREFTLGVASFSG
jgi:hypothetical protein